MKLPPFVFMGIMVPVFLIEGDQPGMESLRENIYLRIET